MTKELDAAPGDIRALKYRIHELEGEVMGYKRILDGQGKAEPVAITHVGAMDHGPFEITPTAHGCDHLKHGDKLYTQAAAEPYAYCVYFPTEQRQEYCQDLDELCEDLTNLEHEITPLYTTPPATQAALTAALEALRELASCGAEAWSADRPCVKDGYAAIAQIEALKGPAP